MLAVERAAAAGALSELKAHLRLEDGSEDALLAGWLRAATEAVELELGQLLLERGVEEIATVGCGAVRPMLTPVRLVEGVDVQDEYGSWVPAGAFALKHGPSRVALSGISDGTEVRLRYRAGRGVGWNDLPELLRHAVVRLAAHFYANRDSEGAAGIPAAVRQLLAPLRIRRLW